MSICGYAGKRAAFVVENGFCEREFIQAHNALTALGVDCRILSLGTDRLVHGWNQEKARDASDWGAGYAVHKCIRDARPSDYDILVIPGGERSITKLMLTSDANVFVTFFMKTRRPVIVYNQGIELIARTGVLAGYSVAVKQKFFDLAKRAGARCSANEFEVYKNLISMSRYRPVDEKLKHAIDVLMQGKPYTGKVVSSDDLPHSHKAA